MILNSDERLEDLQYKGLKIVQNKTLYTFTSDSVILANFVKTKKRDVCVEIGTGSGVISILVNAKNELQNITAFEIQPEMQELCEKNIRLNQMQDKIFLVKDDIKNFEHHLAKDSVDVVFSNPPYFKTTDFEQNQTKKIAKEEVCLDVKSLVNTASQMLKNGGAFYCCFSAERICELISLCHEKRLIVKELFFTENGKGKVKLAVIKAIKGANNGAKVYPNLVTNDENGDYLDTLQTRNMN